MNITVSESRDKEITRQVQIDLITGMPNSIVEWFSQFWKQLEMKPVNLYHHGVDCEIAYYKENYHNRKEFVFYYNSKTNEFKCHYKHFWYLMETKYHLRDNAIEAITKMLFDNINGTNVDRPTIIGSFNLNVIEELIA